MEAPCPAELLFGFVEVLDDFPEWMPLVHRVVSMGDGTDRTPAWDVELRARLGPLARSKRLRMVRRICDAGRGEVVFERSELDDRHHSAWVLCATVTDEAHGSCLHMRLHYGGALWTGGVMERVLADQITAGRSKLLELIAAAPSV